MTSLTVCRSFGDAVLLILILTSGMCFSFLDADGSKDLRFAAVIVREAFSKTHNEAKRCRGAKRRSDRFAPLPNVPTRTRLTTGHSCQPASVPPPHHRGADRSHARSARVSKSLPTSRSEFARQPRAAVP